MLIKRFEADTLSAALDDVRRELGPDALILSTRSRRKAGGRLGLLARTVVEVQAAQERASARECDTQAGAMSEARAPFEEIVRAELASLRREVARLTRSERSSVAPRASVEDSPSIDDRLASEPMLAGLRAAGLEASHAHALADAWYADREAGRARPMVALLQARLEANLAPPREDEGARMRIFVGAPGVGKTTSLAKLAARSEEGERDVALVSLDQARIGASEVLRGYAARVGSPFRDVRDPFELPRVAEGWGRRAVLVDTAGQSPGHDDLLTRLAALREKLGARVSIEQVIEATTGREVQRAQLDRFGALSPDRLIVTKTDECTSVVGLANLVLDPDAPPICWMGTGQCVPDDLEVVDPVRLGCSLLGEAT